ncbi:hypothetical protein Glaag_1660 [Glaciecola sp. 4H-3-7+YE-5]|nr:hypothetical protein Glaag_1660 [Glaciecola sp. 4H-3-7+YE-5]
MKIKLFLLKTAALILMPAFFATAQSDPVQPDEISQSRAAEAWSKVYQVFSHPRCANCHVPDDNLPRWSGPSYGKTSVHGMNISGGQSRIGVETVMCSTCHAHINSDEPHGPPGSPVWMLAPVEMLWWQQSSKQICEQIKDPARNGGRTLEEVAHHIQEDELVHWGWDPGKGREPAPFSAKETADFVTLWANAGAPCPE